MKTGYTKSLIVLLVVAGLALLIYVTGLSHYLSIESIKTNATYYQMKVQSNYITSALSFVMSCTFLIALTLPITIPMGVVAGFLFGFIPGFLYSMIALLVGSTISFLMIRHFFSRIMRTYYGAQLDSFNEKMQSYGYSYLISLQLLSVVPFVIINTLAALAGVSCFTFIWTAAAGAAPIVAIYTWMGRKLYSITAWQDILSKEMLVILILLAGLASLPMIVRKYKERKNA